MLLSGIATTFSCVAVLDTDVGGRTGDPASHRHSLTIVDYNDNHRQTARLGCPHWTSLLRAATVQGFQLTCASGSRHGSSRPAPSTSSRPLDTSEFVRQALAAGVSAASAAVNEHPRNYPVPDRSHTAVLRDKETCKCSEVPGPGPGSNLGSFS